MAVYEIPVRGYVRIEAESEKEALAEAALHHPNTVFKDEHIPQRHGLFRSHALLRVEGIRRVELTPAERRDRAERRLSPHHEDCQRARAGILFFGTFSVVLLLWGAVAPAGSKWFELTCVIAPASGVCALSFFVCLFVAARRLAEERRLSAADLASTEKWYRSSEAEPRPDCPL